MERIYIGIDPGVHTGFAVFNATKQEVEMVATLAIHKAMDILKQLTQGNRELIVIVEDARQRKWFGKGDVSAKLQGAGSIKRDCKIWEDYLSDLGVIYKFIPPQVGATKISKKYFDYITGWSGSSSEHGRDACMLVYGRK